MGPVWGLGWVRICVLGSSRYRSEVVGPESLWQEAVVPGYKALGHAESSEDIGCIVCSRAWL